MKLSGVLFSNYIHVRELNTLSEPNDGGCHDKLVWSSSSFLKRKLHAKLQYMNILYFTFDSLQLLLKEVISIVVNSPDHLSNENAVIIKAVEMKHKSTNTQR